MKRKQLLKFIIFLNYNTTWTKGHKINIRLIMIDIQYKSFIIVNEMSLDNYGDKIILMIMSQKIKISMLKTKNNISHDKNKQ